MSIVYLGFGSNLGDRADYFRLGLEHLRSTGIGVEAVSSLYESEPFYFFEEDARQPWFLNQTVKIGTDLEPLELLKVTQAVESELGRTLKSTMENGKPHYAPRVLDIDILLYGDVILETGELQIPHPRFHLRRYDLVPFAEIAPSEVHPVFKKTIAELLAECKDKSDVHRFASSA